MAVLNISFSEMWQMKQVQSWPKLTGKMCLYIFAKLQKHIYTYNSNLKLQSVIFTSLSPSTELSSVRGVVVFRHGSSVDESNVLRWMCSCQSLHRCGYLLPMSWNIWPKSEFSPYIAIWTSNKSATFVLPNWGKKHYNKSHYQWWLHLKIS